MIFRGVVPMRVGVAVIETEPGPAGVIVAVAGENTNDPTGVNVRPEGGRKGVLRVNTNGVLNVGATGVDLASVLAFEAKKTFAGVE
jgi:hypothetical protein